MAYSPPSGDSLAFAISTGYVAPAGVNLRFWWVPFGDGAANITLLGAATGAIGATGAGAFSGTVVAAGEGYLHPAGVGEARFSMDALAAGAGFISEFGSGAAQVRFAKSAIGIVSPVGSATVVLTPRVVAVGAGDAVQCAGAVVIPVSAAGSAQTSEAIDPVEGGGKAALAFSAQGVGRVSICGMSAARLRLVGAGQAKAGFSGQGALALAITGAGVARRGAVGVGASSFRLSATGRAGAGAAGAGLGGVVIRGNGSANTIAPVAGVGRVTIHLAGQGVAERVIDYSDARVDRLFVRTAARNVFVQAA